MRPLVLDQSDTQLLLGVRRRSPTAAYRVVDQAVSRERGTLRATGLQMTKRTAFSELENSVPLGDRGRVNGRAAILLHPLGRTPRGLVGTGLVLAYRHCRAAAVRAKRGVANKARDPGKKSVDILLPLFEEVEQLRRTLAGIAPNYDVHRARSVPWLCHIRASR